MTKIYASDLSKDKQTDVFMGKGFEDLLKQAEEQDCDLVVGEFFEKPYLDK